jgi:hypothetical protein
MTPTSRRVCHTSRNLMGLGAGFRDRSSKLAINFSTIKHLSFIDGGEGVSQLSLDDKAFSTLADNYCLRHGRKMGFASDKSLSRQWPVINYNAIKRLAKGKLPWHRPA